MTTTYDLALRPVFPLTTCANSLSLCHLQDELIVPFSRNCCEDSINNAWKALSLVPDTWKLSIKLASSVVIVKLMRGAEQVFMRTCNLQSIQQMYSLP